MKLAPHIHLSEKMAYILQTHKQQKQGAVKTPPHNMKGSIIMKNLKRIGTENYDCAFHIEKEPYGVNDFPLIDGKLFTSDEYEWILLDNFGVEISTDCGYDDGDLGDYPEKTLELIKYLIEDAPKKGYIEAADAEDINRICKLLGEAYEG